MPKVTVTTDPVGGTLTWGHFRLVDSVGNASEVAEINPETSMPENITVQKTKAGFQVNDFTIKVKVNGTNTQVEKSANRTADLLKHEQGHFNLLLLTVKALARELEAAAAPTPAALGEQVQTLIANHQERATAVDQAYDEKTNHGLDAAEQKRWNILIDNALRNNASKIDTYVL